MQVRRAACTTAPSSSLFHTSPLLREKQIHRSVIFNVFFFFFSWTPPEWTSLYFLGNMLLEIMKTMQVWSWWLSRGTYKPFENILCKILINIPLQILSTQRKGNFWYPIASQNLQYVTVKLLWLHISSLQQEGINSTIYSSPTRNLFRLLKNMIAIQEE